MLKPLLTSAMLFAATAPAAAHEIWIERDATGPARIYFGEPAADVAEPGEPDAAQLKKPLIFLSDRTKPIAARLVGDHLDAEAPGSADLRLYDTSAFDPWDHDGVKNAAIFHAREGRRETVAKLDFEIVPLAADADRFRVQFQGKPMPSTAVTVIAPGKWQKTLRTDDQGIVAVPNKGAGRYIIVASHGEDAKMDVGGVTAEKLHHVTTLSYRTN
ncbi:DUF4198 domain-containing protein [Sphingomonas sp. C3-2]|uniref:DUF4198 domain-containing protein n=1 Tax=Sphingomonas sp. C3-2 TaxID=3062169 RepID=UPI00294B23C9|nr:DUF4198 domain-containing protein [Sphingomonas sp. C3-2]WOK36796.1 DUF4198 domain-containing protein [Sphingomonas sp. C3-2]